MCVCVECVCERERETGYWSFSRAWLSMVPLLLYTRVLLSSTPRQKIQASFFESPYDEILSNFNEGRSACCTFIHFYSMYTYRVAEDGIDEKSFSSIHDNKP